MLNRRDPLAVDLCSGLGGWAEGLEAEGYDVIRVDIEDMFLATGTPKPNPCLLMVQDILTIHGSQFKDAALIVASPPCTEYSWMAMPWSRAKQVGRALRGQDEFPDNYKGSRTIEQLNALFNACFRIQREASEAAGHHVPMVVENVRGAIPWVGRSAWNFGSFHLWGDVPALMPAAVKARKNADCGGGSWFAVGGPGQTACGANPDGRKVPGFRFDGSGRSFQTAAVNEHIKVPALIAGRRTAPGLGARFTSRDCGVEALVAEGRKGAGAGAAWFDQNLCQLSSKSMARKAASAQIAKIPPALSRHIGRCYLPRD